jgi:MFS family permease
MASFSRVDSGRRVPDEHRRNFFHLYMDIAWYGILSGSAMAFVAVYVARQGASLFQIGLLSAGPGIANLLFALPAGRWLEKRSMRTAVFGASIIHRAFYLLWVPLPALLLPETQIWVLIGLTLLMGIPGVALAIGFNAMFADAVPPEWRGHVAGARSSLLAITYTTTTLLCGYILNHTPFPHGYQVVFGIGCLGAAMSSVHLWFVRPCPGSQVSPRVGRPIGDMARPGATRIIGDSFRFTVGLRFLTRGLRPGLLRTEILRGAFGKVTAIMFAFHLAQYLPVSLFPIYLVDRLRLTDQEIGLGTALFYVTVFLGSTQLGYLTRQWGHHRVLSLGAVLMVAYPALMSISRGLGLEQLYTRQSAAGRPACSSGLVQSLTQRGCFARFFSRPPGGRQPGTLGDPGAVRCLPSVGRFFYLALGITSTILTPVYRPILNLRWERVKRCMWHFWRI